MQNFQNSSYKKKHYVNLRFEPSKLINYDNEILNIPMIGTLYRNLGYRNLDITLDIHNRDKSILLDISDINNNVLLIHVKNYKINSIDGIRDVLSKIISDCLTVIEFTFRMNLDCKVTYDFSKNNYEVWINNYLMVNPFNTKYINIGMGHNRIYPALIIDNNNPNILEIVENVTEKHIELYLTKLFNLTNTEEFGFLIADSKDYIDYYFIARGKIFNDFYRAIYELSNIKNILNIKFEEFKNLLKLLRL